jgi:3'(2'), 5'-bisphosphate nucleotidase
VDRWLQLALDAGHKAGEAIMALYNKVPVWTLKKDGSPLTLADREAHQVVEAHLAVSGIQVISEEGQELHLDATRYWLVDPLDGTKDFLAGNDEFTVNIALIDYGYPVIGVVLAPALGDLYFALAGMNAQRCRNGVWHTLSAQPRASKCRMAVSRFHNHPDVGQFALENKIEVEMAIGSALKYGALAAAEVDVFPRLVGSSEWDTAAGQAVLEAVGGSVLDWETGKRLSYGKAMRRNPRLLASRSPYRYEEFRLKRYAKELS